MLWGCWKSRGAASWGQVYCPFPVTLMVSFQPESSDRPGDPGVVLSSRGRGESGPDSACMVVGRGAHMHTLQHARSLSPRLPACPWGHAQLCTCKLIPHPMCGTGERWSPGAGDWGCRMRLLPGLAWSSSLGQGEYVRQSVSSTRMATRSRYGAQGGR